MRGRHSWLELVCFSAGLVEGGPHGGRQRTPPVEQRGSTVPTGAQGFARPPLVDAVIVQKPARELFVAAVGDVVAVGLTIIGVKMGDILTLRSGRGQYRHHRHAGKMRRFKRGSLWTIERSPDHPLLNIGICVRDSRYATFLGTAQKAFDAKRVCWQFAPRVWTDQLATFTTRQNNRFIIPDTLILFPPPSRAPTSVG